MKKCCVANAGCVGKALLLQAVAYKRNVDCCYFDDATDCGSTGYAEFGRIDCVTDWYGCGWCCLAALSAYNLPRRRCNKWTFHRPSNCDFGRLVVGLVDARTHCGGVLKDFWIEAGLIECCECLIGGQRIG